MDIQNIKNVGISAAYHAGKVLMKYYGNVKVVNKKGVIDLLTEADIESEKTIVNIIQKAFPDHNILAEEAGKNNKNSKFEWIIDPLDGTTNFSHALPIFCISIAFTINGKTEFGLVFNPASQDLFIAEEGKGATHNNQTIKVSKTDNIKESLLVTGFPYNLHEKLPELINRFSNCLKNVQAVRRLGAAALDLCYLACGRFDGFWEQDLKPWDTAAGALIVNEAGGKITDFSGKNYSIYDKEILASNNIIHNQILALL